VRAGGARVPALEACFGAGARFRAVVPNQARPFREHVGPAAAVAQLRAWFDGDVHELVDSGVNAVADRVLVRYRLRTHDAEGWFLVGQQAYLAVEAGAVAACNRVCSGFRPIAAPAGAPPVTA